MVSNRYSNVRYKIIPTKVLVLSKKKSTTQRKVYVWRNVNLITPPSVVRESKVVFNKKTRQFEEHQLPPVVKHIPDTTHIKTTRDLGYCGTL